MNYIHVWQRPSSIWLNITHMTNNIHELNFMLPSLLCLIAFVWSISSSYYVSLIASTQSCLLYVMNIYCAGNMDIAKLYLCVSILPMLWVSPTLSFIHVVYFHVKLEQLLKVLTCNAHHHMMKGTYACNVIYQKTFQ